MLLQPKFLKPVGHLHPFDKLLGSYLAIFVQTLLRLL
ncbi:Uncharacterised protein [Vibrio cholerae]|nr:Uncharacterised protein [Vibrio cholerae]